MRRHLITCGCWLASALLAVVALGGCALPAVGATTTPQPAPTATISGTPLGWSVYHGDHFTIAYPPQWSYTFSIPPAEAGGDPFSELTLNGPQPRNQITIIESPFPQDQLTSICTTTGQTATHLAGLPMVYQAVEGVHRQWTFVTSKRISYLLSTFDGDSSATVQTQSDAILATFRPDDTTPGCP